MEKQFPEWTAFWKLLVHYMQEHFSIGFLLYCSNDGILNLGKLLDSSATYVHTICGKLHPVKDVSNNYNIGHDQVQNLSKHF